jgi:hypothetical protein
MGTMFKIKILLILSLLTFLMIIFIPRLLAEEKAGQVNSHTFESTKDSKQVDTNNKQEKSDVIHYKGIISRDIETHYYLFTTKKKGVVDVTWGAGTVGSDFIITDKNWSTMYFNGDKLPAGEYMFVITTNPAESTEEPILVNYHFLLRGLNFTSSPDTTLPTLEVKNPTSYITSLPEGNQSVLFSVTSDSHELYFGLFETTDLPKERINSPFRKEILFNDSSPVYSIYRVSAIHENGNRINRNYEFIYGGGVKQ